MVWLVAAHIAGASLVFDPSAIQSFDLPKALLGQALLAPIAVCVGLLLYRYGGTVVPSTRLHLLPLAVVLVVTVSTIFAVAPYVAVFGEKARYLGLLFTVDMLVLYGAVVVAFRRPRDWAVLAAALALTAVITFGYAVVQRLGLDPIRWAADPRERPFSTMGNPDQYGELLTIVFSLAAAIAIFYRGRAVRIGASAIAIGALLVSAVVATRGSLVGMTAAAIALGVAYLRARGWTRTAAARLGVGVVAVVMVSALLWVSPLGARLYATFAGVDLRPRLFIYESAVAALGDRPIFGYGPDSFAVAYPAHRQPEAAVVLGPGVPESSAHDWPLQAAVTTGLAGFVALTAFIVATLYLLGRVGLKRNPLIAAPAFVALVAYASQGLVSVGSVAIDWVPWIACGVAVVTLPREAAVAPRRARRLSPVAQSVFVGGACLVGLFVWPALDASHHALRAASALSGGGDVALHQANAALSLDAGRADYWNLRGLALDLTQRWRESGDAYAEAARRAPYEAVFWENLARSRARQTLAEDQTSGGQAAALKAAHTAIDRDPNNPEAYAVLAEIASAFDDQRTALSAIVRAIAIYPFESSYDRIAASAADRVDDPGIAREALEQILKVRENVILRLALAKTAVRLGDCAAAVANATWVLDHDSTNAEANAIIIANR